MVAEPALLRVLKGKRLDPPPIWLMRQAGRWLPEYRALRAARGGFLGMVYDPPTATEITLQPIRRFAMDGAILFSDILVVAHALGQTLSFVEGEGPRLAPPLADADPDALVTDPTRYPPVWETVRQLRAALGPETTLIGFAGAPWTVATYMVAGHGSRDEARQAAFSHPENFARLIDLIVASTIDYLIGQIEAGAQAVQIFDSWSGALSADQFERWSIAPTRAIVAAVKARHPETPIIGFPRGAGAKIIAYAERTGIDAIGLDETIDAKWAHAHLPAGMPVQGNIDNLALVAGGDMLTRATAALLEAFAGRPHIVNLGHGCVPHTPIPHVEALLRQVRR